MLVCPTLVQTGMSSLKRRQHMSHTDHYTTQPKRMRRDVNGENGKADRNSFTSFHSHNHQLRQSVRKLATRNGGRRGSTTGRRKASLKAEVAVQLILGDTPLLSPSASESDMITSGSCDTQNEVVVELQTLQNGNLAYQEFITSATHVNGKEGSDNSMDALMIPMSVIPDRMALPQQQSKLEGATKTLPNHTKKSALKNPSPQMKRMASLNARACVAAMIEPEKRVAKSTHSLPCPQEEDTAMSTVPVATDQLPILSSEEVLQQCAIVAAVGKYSSSYGEFELPEYLLVASHQQSPLVEEEIDLDAIPYNNLGLLYNGSTISPHACIYLTREGKVPSRIIPMVVPATAGSLKHFVEVAHSQQKQKTKKSRAVKGDNGWTCIGDPIKTLKYVQDDNLITRKYYIGIKRRKEEVYVRDCIAVRAGRRKQDKPYIAKIASLWKEKGGIMMSVLWYYRPEETENTGDVQENELFASQHHDDNGVACIEEKCHVLGYNEYCRRQAVIKRAECGLGTEVPTPVPELSSLKGDKVKPSLVYLCYRGYNHLTGRVLKGTKVY